MERELNLPILRFPEFNGTWKVEKLGNLLTERSEFTSENLPLYSLTIEDGVTPKSERYERAFLVNDLDGAYKVVHKDDFVYNPMNLRFGALAKLRENKKVLVSKYYNIFYSNDFVDSTFLESYLTTRRMISFYDRMSTGSLVEKKRVHYSDFVNFYKPFPSLPEQQKIASFLTAVDEKIQVLKRKKSLLEQYKKGIMQQLFSQEIRFKDENGNDYPDWEEKKLGEIADVKGGKRIPKGYELQSESNGYPYITVSDMKNGSVALDKIQYVPLEVKDQIRNYRITTKDIFISVAGTLGIIGIIPEKLNNANLTENANKLTNLKCNQIFLLYILNSDSFKKLVDNVKTVGAQPKLAIYAINSFSLALPSLPEQTKIANFLSAIDEKIEKEDARIKQAEVWKKGLLQQLFV